MDHCECCFNLAPSKTFRHLLLCFWHFVIKSHFLFLKSVKSFWRFEHELMRLRFVEHFKFEKDPSPPVLWQNWIIQRHQAAAVGYFFFNKHLEPSKRHQKWMMIKVEREKCLPNTLLKKTVLCSVQKDEQNFLSQKRFGGQSNGATILVIKTLSCYDDQCDQIGRYLKVHCEQNF